MFLHCHCTVCLSCVHVYRLVASCWTWRATLCLKQLVSLTSVCACVCFTTQYSSGKSTELNYFISMTFIQSYFMLLIYYQVFSMTQMSKLLHIHVKCYNWTPVSSLCSDEIVGKHMQDGLIDTELREKISFILLRKHRHQTKKPIHRSLADIGKLSSSSKGFGLQFFYELCYCFPDVGEGRSQSEIKNYWHPQKPKNYRTTHSSSAA